MKQDFHGIEVNIGQKRILEYLLTQQHSKTAYEISKATDKSWYYTIHLLRDLKHRGIIIKSGSGFKIRKEIIDNFIFTNDTNLI